MSDVIKTVNFPSEQEKEITGWQKKLLPWMVLLPTLLIAVFIILATMRMRNFETFTFNNQPSVFLNTLPSPADTQYLFNRDIQYQKLYTLAKMEEYALNRRYNQAGIITMSTIYTKYLGFFTGMILAIVGSVFIISKLREAVSEVEGSYKEAARLKFISSSPGIIFALLGTILMSISILNKGAVAVDDMPLYLNHTNFIGPGTNIDSFGIQTLPGPDSKSITTEQADSSDPNK
jgi:hypothetical protein